MKKHYLILCFFLLFLPDIIIAQSAKTDSLIRNILSSESLTDDKKGTELLLNGNLSAAGQYFNSEIKTDEANVDAYFGRGIVHMAMNDTMSACRDWSAVLALGDTASYILLESHCNATMIIEDDIIPQKKYREMFSMERREGKVLSDATKARTIVEEMPQFPGGDAGLIKFLNENIIIPSPAKIKNLKGTVYVNFVISSKGNILFPYVVRGIGGGCDEEAIRVIKKMPSWKPGKHKGKAVLVRYNLPVKFN